MQGEDSGYVGRKPTCGGAASVVRRVAPFPEHSLIMELGDVRLLLFRQSRATIPFFVEPICIWSVRPTTV